MHKAGHYEHPGHRNDEEVGVAQRQRQRDQDIEQKRQLELIAEAVTKLGGAGWPVRFAQRDVLESHFPVPERTGPGRGRPDEQRESEPDLDQDGQQNHLNRYEDFPGAQAPPAIAAAPAPDNQSASLNHNRRWGDQVSIVSVILPRRAERCRDEYDDPDPGWRGLFGRTARRFRRLVTGHDRRAHWPV